MKNITTLIVAANLALLVLLAIFLPELMISPGKTIQAHSEIENDCFACHTVLVGSQPDKCIACHKVDEIGKKSTKGVPLDKKKQSVAFHQQLIEEDCVACHSDHKGVQPFRPIGQFSHELLEPTLEKQCDGCHQAPKDSIHSKKSSNCGECHQQDGWSPASLDHDQYFRFDRHHDAECKVCHEGNDYSKYTCFGCHEHSPRNIRGEHLEEGIYNYEICVECHRSGNEHEAERIWRQKLYQERKGQRSERPYQRYRNEHDDDHEHDDDDD